MRTVTHFFIVSILGFSMAAQAAPLNMTEQSKVMTSIIMYLLSDSAGSGTSSSTSSQSSSVSSGASSSLSNDPKYSYEYEGMPLYTRNMPISAYRLTSLSNAEFNALTLAQKRIVADKLLATLYFGLPKTAFETMIQSPTFISDIQTMITQKRNDIGAIETRLNDNGEEEGHEFEFWRWPEGTAQISRILARFYILEHLDKHYIDYWSAYILTSTIMFSPAYELESSHTPNIDRVYGDLVRHQRDDCSIEYLTFMHMISEDNWRRFRSPEDNGREMLEIFLLDFNDSHVPMAGQTLKNWKLDRESDTLVIGLDDNTQPVSLFGTSVTDGFDFYRELAKSDAFIKGTASRLVDIYFPNHTQAQKNGIIDDLIDSGIGTWQDLLLQIVFSKAYLLESDKPKSAEELFYSQSRKTYFGYRSDFFSRFAQALLEMHQAPMKYKLGRYTEVPLDTQSFLSYHKAIREGMMIQNKLVYSDGWVTSGWQAQRLLADSVFSGVPPNNPKAAAERLIDHLFLSTLVRPATQQEKNFFTAHFLNSDGTYKYEFDLFQEDDPLEGRIRAGIAVMDYISRLAEFYRFAKVSQ